MTKKTTNLLGILIAILAGIYFYVMYCSECSAAGEKMDPLKEEMVVPVAAKATSNPFSFSDGDYAYTVNDNFNFKASSSTILTPVSLKVGDGIASLKNFLAENLGKSFNITGFYKNDENNDSAFPNLGLARANAVKNYLVSKGIPSARINTLGELMEEMVPKETIYIGPVSYSLEGKSAGEVGELKVLYEQLKANPLILYFETAQASIDLTPEQRKKIADISRYLDKVEGATCSIVGYTDNTGLKSKTLGLDGTGLILQNHIL